MVQNQSEATFACVCECCKRAQLSCLVLNIFRYTDTVMGSGLFYDLHMRNKNRCSLRHRTLSYWLCRVALFSPRLPLLTPPPSHPSSPLPPLHQCGCYLFTQYLLLLHSSRGWIMAIFPRVKPYCKAHILKISICWRGRRAATDLRDQRVHTAPQRSRTATAGGPSALNYIKGPFFFFFFLKVHWVTKMEKIYASMFLVG